MTVAEKIPILQLSENSTEREEWVQAISTLIAEVTEWSHSLGWRTAVHDTGIIDESWPEQSQKEYIVPVLDIITEQNYSGLAREVKLVIEPVFFDPARSLGRVDFYVWPALYRVRLLHKTGSRKWVVKTDSNVNWPMPWNRDSFVLIAEGLMEV